MKATRMVLLLTGAFAAVGANPLRAAEPPSIVTVLSSADQLYLDGLLKQFLFDPRGAQYVCAKTTRRTVWASSEEFECEGWFVAGNETQAARIYFCDGESIAAPEPDRIEKLDFVDMCRKEYAKSRQMVWRDFGQFDLIVAAWLYRLDQPEVAAEALAQARKKSANAKDWGDEDPPPKETEEERMTRQLKEDLAWRAFGKMVHAYMYRADEEAMTHGERLTRLLADVAKKECPQASAILDDLKRRKAKGTFGQTPPDKWPEGFDSWNQEKKIYWLIDSLDEVDARQHSSPGGVPFETDRRVAALIEIGDPAVPSLIDAVEKDRRLTRSVHFWRDYDRGRTVLEVREAALTAIMSILKIHVFEPRVTGDNFTSRGPKTSDRVVAWLRAYWKKYGAMPIENRMMLKLTDPKADFETLREAAYNLGHFGEKWTLNTTWGIDRFPEMPKRPNRTVAKFSNPTVAEAILAAMDRELAHHAAGERDWSYDFERRRIEDSYLEPLARLGDQRIAAELARRCDAADAVGIRRKYASACHALGNSKPLDKLAAEVEKGSLKLPANDKPRTNPNDQPGNVELDGLVAFFIQARTRECERALYALTAPGHPYHKLAVERVLLAYSPGYDDKDSWLKHPFSLAVLREALNDSTPTGRTMTIEGNREKETYTDGSYREGSISEEFADPAVRRSSAVVLQRDRVAAKIGEIVLGMPWYSPLYRDNEARLAELKASLDRYGGRFRLLSNAERMSLKEWHAVFVPDISPLDHPATEKDVQQGRAVFHLDGQSKPATVRLPAVANLRQEIPSKKPSRVLVVQAEIGQDGKTTYGIISDGAIRAATAEEITAIEPIAAERPETAN